MHQISYLKNSLITWIMLSFSGGIIFAINTTILSLLWYIIIIFIAFLCLIYTNKLAAEYFHSWWIFSLTVCIVFFILGITVTTLKINMPVFSDYWRPKSTIEAIITDTPEEKTKCYAVIAKIIHVNKIKTTGKALFYLEKDTIVKNLLPGTVIQCKPLFQQIDFYNNPGEFNYKKKLYYQDIHRTCYLKKNDWKIITKSTFNLRYIAIRYREKLLSILRKNSADEDEFAIISAMLLGQKNYITQPIKEVFSDSGAIHILAVSGFHVGMIILFFGLLFYPLKNYNKTKKIYFLLIIISIWLYAFISGLSSSVCRASLMASFMLGGTLFKRPINIFNSLSTSALILLIINPFIITDIGFQLSFLAVTGIILFYPLLYTIISPTNFIIKKIWSLCCVSVSAQILITPLLIYYFQSFSTWFLLTNILIIPLASGIIYSTIPVFIFYWATPISGFFSKVSSVFTKALINIVNLISDLPFILKNCLTISPFSMFLYYLLFISILTFFSKRAKYSIFVILFSIIGIISMSIIKEFNENRKDQLIVLNIPKKQVFIIKQNKSFYIFAQDTISENGYIYNKFLKPIIKQSTYKITFPKNVPGTNQPQNKLIKTAHRTIITLNNNLMINKWDIKKNNILIISKNILPPRNILNSLKENDIILDSSCTQEQQIIWRKFCEENKIICYFTTKQATIINL